MKSIYEVRLEAEAGVAAEYLVWLRQHMKDLVKVAGFERAELFELEHADPQVKIWVVQYLAESRRVIGEYLNVHSKAFRAEGAARFGTKVKIERRILVQLPP